MKYIDKNIHLELGNSYSSDFLYESFNEESQCFIPAISSKQAYTDFTHKKYRYGEGMTDGRSGFEMLLIEEQDGRCCYCMGRVEPRFVALEHIIPESFTGLNAQNEYAYYASKAPVLAENTELAETFSQRQFTAKEEMKKLKKYPHLISYVNLTASCHGVIEKRNGTSCFCNHPRGNARIVPIMLLPAPLSLLEYDCLGSVVHKDISECEIKNTINILCLNHDTLQEIRLLWYKVSRSDKAATDILSITQLVDKISFLKEVFQTNDYTTLEEKWKKYAPILPVTDNMQEQATPYWDLFVRYDWFYGYYQKTYS